ncbi:MAG: hypothetical protein FWG63_00720 [Defluviitaleaceae bacterium]|nr:hypothetical protein [Defluviitaleaceae bacterium]
MFIPRYKSRGRRGEQPQPPWAVEVEKKLIELRLTKTDFAAMFDLNYTAVVTVLTGSRVSPSVQRQIIAKIRELETQRGEGVAV